MITELIKNYNAYMEFVFNNNQFLISVVTGGLLGSLSYIAYQTPKIAKKFMYKYLLTRVTIDSMQTGYYNIMDRIGIDKKLMESVPSYAILSGRWGYGNSKLTIGDAAMFFTVLHNTPCIIYINKEKFNELYIYEANFYIPRFMGYSFASKIYNMAKEPHSSDQTYNIILTENGNTEVIKQDKENIDSYVKTRSIRKVLDIVDNFISSKDKYIKSGVPYKLGLLLDGVPGTGKTSIVRYIASYYSYDLVLINTISELETAARIESERPIIILVDEIDLLITHNRDSSESSKDDNLDKRRKELIVSLKALDGIIKQEGRILIGTTNNGNCIDNALKRPGRFDHVVKFEYLDKDEIKMFIDNFYNIDVTVDDIRDLDNIRPVDLQKDFMSLSEEDFFSKYLNK